MPNVLICTLGESAAILTETLWALLNREQWRPDRIEVVTTSRGLDRIRAGLLGPHTHLHSLYSQGSPPPVTIFVPRMGGETFELRWAGGSSPAPTASPPNDLMTDIDSEADALAMGDLIKTRVADAALQGARIHVSIAGGRKTMSAHALLSLALFGNPGDEASHVIVGPAFEGNRQFWHPDQATGHINTIEEQRAATRDKTPLPAPGLDPIHARDGIMLIPTATPLFLGEKADRKSFGKLKLSEIIEQQRLVGRFARDPMLRVHLSDSTVEICGLRKPMNIAPFVKLTIMAIARRDGWTAEGDPSDHPAGLLSFHRMAHALPEPGLARLLDQTIRKALSSIGASDPRQNIARSYRAKFIDNVKAFPGKIPAVLEQIATQGDPRKKLQLQNSITQEIFEWFSITDVQQDLEKMFGLPLRKALIVRTGKKPVAFGLTLPPDRIQIC